MASMTSSDPLFALSSAEIAPKAASALLRRFLIEEPRAGERVYRAFRAWCWKALTERRFDEELRLWFDLLRKTAAALGAKRQKEAAQKLLALSDLVYESIQFAEHEPVSVQLARAHVRTILIRLNDAGELDKRALMEVTSLKQANLSRVVGGLISCGLVERQPRGREAVFRLTRRGLDACRTLPRPAEPVLIEGPRRTSPHRYVKRDILQAVSNARRERLRAESTERMHRETETELETVLGLIAAPQSLDQDRVFFGYHSAARHTHDILMRHIVATYIAKSGFRPVSHSGWLEPAAQVAPVTLAAPYLQLGYRPAIEEADFV